ncbi:hypothetical protein B0H11DRAFT_1926049 [Mycena galericulata]|nr:hypothetical protein B0H11DRAFT_1926049 [Mycena galericulata]
MYDPNRNYVLLLGSELAFGANSWKGWKDQPYQRWRNFAQDEREEGKKVCQAVQPMTRSRVERRLQHPITSFKDQVSEIADANRTAIGSFFVASRVESRESGGGVEERHVQ